MIVGAAIGMSWPTLLLYCGAGLAACVGIIGWDWARRQKR